MACLLDISLQIPTPVRYKPGRLKMISAIILRNGSSAPSTRAFGSLSLNEYEASVNPVQEERQG